MESEHITCVLELAAVVCYGFLILALVLYWPNEANAYLLLFCWANGILALKSSFKPKENSELCRWNGLLTLLALTLGFDSLYRSQVERRRMAEHNFRLYKRRPLCSRMMKSCLFSVGASFAAWGLYTDNPTMRMCFFKASDAAKLDETMISFFWILFFFIRPVAMTIKHSPQIILSCHRQVQVLKHERELSINGKLLLYKDHHRRLFHVIFSSVTQIVMIVWLTLTTPYIMQMISLVAGLNAVMKLEELSSFNASIIIYMHRALPLVNCFFLMGAFIVVFSLRLKR